MLRLTTDHGAVRVGTNVRTVGNVVHRAVFVAAALAFFAVAGLGFLRRGQWLGGVIFLAAGTWFFVLAWRRR